MQGAFLILPLDLACLCLGCSSSVPGSLVMLQHLQQTLDTCPDTTSSHKKKKAERGTWVLLDVLPSRQQLDLAVNFSLCRKSAFLPSHRAHCVPLPSNPEGFRTVWHSLGCRGHSRLPERI